MNHGNEARHPAYLRCGELYDIVDRRKNYPSAFSSAADFSLARAASSDPSRSTCYVPYCFDFLSGSVLFTAHSDVMPLYTSAFLYESQFRTATGVLKVPIAAINVRDESDPPSNIGFIFSPGRCGSTALARALQGVPGGCISEPDILTQLAIEWAVLHPSTRDRYLRVAVDVLVDCFRGCKFVKLRSQCTEISEKIISCAPAADVIFIFRELKPWANSMRRAFPIAPEYVAEILLSSVRAYARATANKRPHCLIWYEDMLGGAPVELKCRGSASEMIEVVINYSEDAQAGTSLARDNLSTIQIPSGYVDRVISCWSEFEAAGKVPECGINRRLIGGLLPM